MRNYFIAAAMLAASVSTAQNRDTTRPAGAPQLTNLQAAGGFGGGAQRQGPRAYKDVITNKAISQKGMITVHKVDDKYYFEVPNNILGREILAVTRYIKVPAISGNGRGAYGGEVANQQTLAFEKGPNSNIFLRTITLVNAADPKDDIYKAVTNSNLNAIAAAFPIAAYGKDSASVVLDVTDYFKGDNQVVSINTNIKRSLGLGLIAADRSYIQKITTYPINTEIRSVKTFNAAGATAPAGFGGQGGGASIPAANAAGAVTIELNTSMLLLPEKPMTPRIADKRVGFFTDDYVLFGDDQQKVENKEFAVRWRLEPKDEDVEKWKR